MKQIFSSIIKKKSTKYSLNYHRFSLIIMMHPSPKQLSFPKAFFLLLFCQCKKSIIIQLFTIIPTIKIIAGYLGAPPQDT
jgi:hypothetical protein